MSNAKANILAKLKKQLQGAERLELSAEPVAEPEVLNQTQNVETFVQLLSANHAEVLCITRDEIAATVKTQLQKRNIDRLMCGTPWVETLQAIESEITLNTFYPVIDGHKEALFNTVPAAITGSHCGIAATGSIVLWPTPEEPRTLSLVPPVHIVVVERNAICNDLATAMKTQAWKAQLPTNVVLVSGPSKTADIQQTLAYGAHGPRELVVLLIGHSK